MKLTIAVITMNRSGQLKTALQSCLNCDLPQDTQFVIIDNASTDDTDEVVKELFECYTFKYVYRKNKENVGVGKGRNIAFKYAEGQYVYLLDDDAYIDENQKDFFQKAISILDKYPQIATLTTQIYDLIWKANRVSTNNPKLFDGLQKCYMLCGGSHFLRAEFWGNEEPYFNNKYGYEEILPSLRVHDAGMLNVTCIELNVIHNPKINKWDYSEGKNKDIIIGELVNQLKFKSILYPFIGVLFVYLAFLIRFIKYLSFSDIPKCKQRLVNMKQYSMGRRIKTNTFFYLYRDFGFTVL